MDFIASLFSALNADSALAALLDEFEGEAAIFSGDALPVEEFKAKPVVWIRPPHGADNVDTFSAVARSLELDVSFYAKATGSSAAIDAAAERARVVLHRQTLSGPPELSCTVSGPFGAPTSDVSIAGRRLAVRLFVKG